MEMKLDAKLDFSYIDKYSKMASRYAVTATVKEAQRQARKLVPVDTGSLRRRIKSRKAEMSLTGNMVVGELYVETVPGEYDYSRAVEYGTGIYSTYPGSPRRYIVPKIARYLKFLARRPDVPYNPYFIFRRFKKDTKEMKVLHADAYKYLTFRRKVKGQKKQPYLRPAMKTAQKKMLSLFKQRLDYYLRSD